MSGESSGEASEVAAAEKNNAQMSMTEVFCMLPPQAKY
jgi:hypothetical protein